MQLPKTLLGGAKDLLPDYVFLSMSHRQKIGRFPNLLKPTTFNEKILYRCLHPDPRYADLTDKLTVRDYVKSKIGEEYLIPLIAEPDSFDRDVFDSLPSAFVMKANHGSSFVKVVKDKSTTSFEELTALADQWLSKDFYRVARERHYHAIKHRIYFETLLLDERGDVPADYKLHIFAGAGGRRTVFICVISDRFNDHPRGDFYDAQWNLLDIGIGHFERSKSPDPRPENLSMLLDIGERLAEDFEYVRVDLYSPRGRVYFGELTFTPGAGVLQLRPDSVDYEWGTYFRLHERVEATLISESAVRMQSGADE
ncbi:hypothetical protein AWB81_00434 [Caballeronia arationis]|jgi:hypothetical protein|uniref:ATP-grasp fold amidoligase family protein n=1 Tax=Caballeronia arationis TaxID=1777142 RepID=UPI00074BE589|nr:ATP-grasp fold amidoligase family protein [Caballeronia arationis]SAK46022.1 hypothetical protein AWB81_00434 [Caballeronia arationis]